MSTRQHGIIHVNRAAADNCRGNGAFQRPPVKRRVLRFRFQRRRANGDAGVWREDREIGWRAVGERAAGGAENACRIDGQELDQARQADDAGVNETIEAQRDRGLEADDAEGRAVEFERLLVGVMRRVIRGDDASRSGGFILVFVSKPPRSASAASVSTK